MLLAVMLLAGMPDWIPARWHSADPKSLELLSGTPVNCLLLDAPFQDPAFVRQANARGIAILGVLRPGDDLPGAAQRAAAARLTGIVLEGDFDPAATAGLRARTGLPIVELPTR